MNALFERQRPCGCSTLRGACGEHEIGKPDFIEGCGCRHDGVTGLLIGPCTTHLPPPADDPERETDEYPLSRSDA